MGRRYGNRWGRFNISGYFLEELGSMANNGEWDRLEALTGFMVQVLIVRAQDRVCGDCVEYVGVSRHFEELEEGEEIPEYMLEFQRVRTCNACGGTEWGQPNTIDPGPHDPCCKGCAAPQELSRFVDHVKAVRRVRYRLVSVPGHISEESLANFKREWNAMMKKKGWEIP
jgi:hypothetical protein